MLHAAGLLLLLLLPCTAATEAVVRGVSLGGWLLSESWITPSLYSSRRLTDPVPDEYTLTSQLGRSRASQLLEAHWSSFYTRRDLAEIRDAGLTHVRIPVGYWAVVELLEDEPYVAGQYPYLIRAVQWARELGLKVMIDLHGLPGSQNGQDNSGREGPVLFTADGTNLARTLGALRNLTAEFTRAEYGGAVESVQVMNEPRLTSSAASPANFTMLDLQSAYMQGAQVIRFAAAAAAGLSDAGEGKEGGREVDVVLHDAFWGPAYWATFDPFVPEAGTDAGSAGQGGSNATAKASVVIDSHQYYTDFSGRGNLPRDEILERICNFSTALKHNPALPRTVVGEWALETGTPPGVSSRASSGLSREHRTWLRKLWEAQRAAYEPLALAAEGEGRNGTEERRGAEGWYYWCWKTEYDYPTWSYRRGLAEGYIPSNASDPAALAFPVRADGCVDSAFAWEAPERAGKEGAGAARWGRAGWGLGMGALGAALAAVG